MHSKISTSFENITILKMKEDIRIEKREDAILNINAPNDSNQPSSSRENVQNKSTVLFKNTMRKILIKLLPSCRLKNKLREKQIRSKISSNESLLNFYNNVNLQTLTLNNSGETVGNISTNNASFSEEDPEYSTLDSRENHFPDLPYDENSSNETFIKDNSTEDLRVALTNVIDDIMKIIEESLLVLDDNNQSIQINNVITSRTDDKIILDGFRRPIEAAMKQLEVNIRDILQSKEDFITDMVESLKAKLDERILSQKKNLLLYNALLERAYQKIAEYEDKMQKNRAVYLI